MATQILAVQPRRQDLRTSTTEDWTDALPLYRAGPAAVVAGAQNVGNGALTVSAVQPYTAVDPHVVTVSSAGDLAIYTVTGPEGVITGRGVAGTVTQAGGLTLTLTSGSVPFAIGDTFAVQPTPVLINDTGFTYLLQVRASQMSPVVVLEAMSHPPAGVTPTIIAGNGTGVPTLLVPYTLMAPDRFPPMPYVYEMLVIADGRRKTSHFGNLTHFAGVAYLP